jgi:hypothetical protein
MLTQVTITPTNEELIEVSPTDLKFLQVDAQMHPVGELPFVKNQPGAWHTRRPMPCSPC